MLLAAFLLLGVQVMAQDLTGAWKGNLEVQGMEIPQV